MKNKNLQMKWTAVTVLMAMLLGVVGMAKANPVDMRTAREVAVKFVNANTKVQLRNADELQLVTTYNISRGDAAFYVFNTPNGFVIVSADDCATPILGYSNEGRFDVENIPIQLQDYLQGFVEQIQYGIENHIGAKENVMREWELVRTTGRLNENRDGEVVEPLITALWDQGCYYNAMCPEHEHGFCGHCVTGCAATAMAQILHYWGYPEHGTGSHTYTPPGYPEQSVDFGATTYDWDNMPNSLSSSSSSEQIDAVATLMWHCGVSVNMNYGPFGSGGYLSPSPLIDYFDYSNDMHLENRQDDESWMSLLKTDLDVGRPVYYVGSDNVEGHAFVCDGYDANDRFHFNWGWGGGSNGYFALNDITYCFGNYAIFNIHPNATISFQVTASANPSDGGLVSGAGMYDIGSICTLTATASEGYTFMYWTEDGEVVSTQEEYSFSVRKDRDLVAHFEIPFYIGVMLVPEEGGTVSGAGEYTYGSTCTLTASNNEGYDFICWRWANGNVVSTAPTCSFIVTEATTLTAVFAVSGGEQIPFADLNVKAICVAHWDTNSDGELSYAEAAEVRNIGTVFRYSDIAFFDELQYFTGLTSIGDYAFYYCTGLTSIEIPDSVTFIGDYSFQNCTGLTSIEIPNSVTTIGNSAFRGCSGFTGNLTVPNSVTVIGNNAFYGCSGFTGSLTIPNSVTEIGDNAFYGCSGFTGSLTLGNSLTTISDAAFSCCSGFTGSLTIPNSVTTIGNSAFYNCSGFTGSLTIPDSVTTIGRSAFYRCSGFTGSLTIGNSVTTIDQHAFRECSGFTGSLTIPSSVTLISHFAFYNCSGFTGSLIIPNSVTLIGGYAFSYCSGLTGDLIIGDSVTSIGGWAFYYCSGFTGSLTLGNSLTTIGIAAFCGCRGFTGNLTIPNSVTEISNGAFQQCRGFTGSLTIPNSVTSIEMRAFCSCSGFTGDLVIPNSVTAIGSSAFFGCSGFTGSLTIPNFVTSIGESAFSGCSGLTSMTVWAENPPTLGSNAFYNVDKSIPVYVLCGSLDAYQNASGWNEFTNIQEICTQTQTITLSEGWNWFSTNMEITLEDLQNALVDAAPNTNITIKSNTQNIAYNPGTNQWRGTLDSLDVSQMYMIQVGADCQITLTGTSINPNACPITIHNGNNWIAFPLSESMSISDAFSGFATNGDIIKGRTTTARYNNGNWRGGLDSLEPGQGYIYKSNVTETRTFTFPTSAK